MTRWIVSVALVCTACASLAQEGATAQSPVDDLHMQRRQIDVVRKEKMAEFDAQESGCVTRFAVTDCQNKVGVQRRALLADLKRQEARVNEADRRQKGIEQLQRNEEKALDRTQRRSGSQAVTSENSHEERQRVLDEKVLNHKNGAKKPMNPEATHKSASGLDAPTIEKKREAYAAKQRAADQRRQDREKRLLQNSSHSAPLPSPP